MIDSILCYWWLARYGCDLSKINFFSGDGLSLQASVYIPFHIEILFWDWDLHVYIPSYLKKCWMAKDWVAAKKYLNRVQLKDYTDEKLDDIPF